MTETTVLPAGSPNKYGYTPRPVAPADWCTRMSAGQRMPRLYRRLCQLPYAGRGPGPLSDWASVALLDAVEAMWASMPVGTRWVLPPPESIAYQAAIEGLVLRSMPGPTSLTGGAA